LFSFFRFVEVFELGDDLEKPLIETVESAPGALIRELAAKHF
jgi:hypothetical protein